ncbi:unnamed protein product [Callosobruchus maculatus]|uniref:Uncharacterized protein n=1 Tax=Callosobruchus maculatus TaxID=64391 RepID=A0A653DD79_CALMS|nr:unnamed protein product [Callosobruchus maculatus]
MPHVRTLHAVRLHTGARILRPFGRLPGQVPSGREGARQSGSSEDRTPGAMARAITVHADTKKVMYFA